MNIFLRNKTTVFLLIFLNIIAFYPYMNIIQPISISSRAKSEIENIITEKLISDNYGLRVGLKGAGCGATYLLGFDLPSSDDEVYDIQNIKVIINRKHLMYLLGIGIDFEKGEEGLGFTFLPKN